MSILLAREVFAAFYPDARPLLAAHAHEISHYKDIELDVDVGAYHATESLGRLRIYTARDEGRLVGYAAFCVHQHLHYQKSLWAIEDVIYVAPEHRGRMLGVRLLRYSEDELAREGVQVVMHHSKVKHPELGRLLERCGYEASDILWVKRLDPAQTEQQIAA